MLKALVATSCCLFGLAPVEASRVSCEHYVIGLMPSANYQTLSQQILSVLERCSVQEPIDFNSRGYAYLSVCSDLCGVDVVEAQLSLLKEVRSVERDVLMRTQK